MILLLLCAPAFVTAQSALQTESAEASVEDRARGALELLTPLLELEASLREQLAAANAATDADAEEQAAELERLRAELDGLQAQMTLVVTGVSEEVYEALDGKEFDLNSELQSLIEPFVLVLNEATNDARELERSRRSLEVARKRLESAEIALENIAATRSENPSAEVLARLEADFALWSERQTLHQTQMEALEQRIVDLQMERTTVGGGVNSAFQVFFRDRSVSLLMGLGAFFGVLATARALRFAAQRLVLGRVRTRSFAMRLGGIIFLAVSVVGSFMAMLVVFNMRNDWLLLGLAMVLFIAGLWVLLKMLPGLVEQGAVLLNLGSVQEGERVLFNGVPFKVHRLSFFTDLVNPALDGGEFTLPVRELIGMHSRPAAQDEAWFPSRKGDWVRLSDDTAGQVVAQTPEMVVVQTLGGARVTYQTPDFLAATPENLSHGYRTEVVFGIGYAHRADAADTVITQMRDGVRAHFAPLLDPSELLGVDVEFLRAGASSLDYEVEIDVAGSAAHRFEELERELARCLVMLANTHGWDIPFPQMTVHRAGAGASAG
jgi:hypothetical protein